MAETVSWSGITRGTCPACSSDDVTYLLVGLVVFGELEQPVPQWVELVGCAHPGHNRQCNGCGHRWERT